jgi:hypothetical protein
VKHFSPIEWVDFVRNVVPTEHRAPMQEHLDQGCGTCLKMVKTWATMVDFARHEPFYEPPDGAVRNAGSYFFSFSLTLQERNDVRILRHIFDSFSMGTLNGIRGAGTAPRQLLYNSYTVFIDLRLEPKPGSDSIALTGQVVDAQLTDGILEEIPVLLFSKGDMEVETTTNRFGEFNFAFKAAGHLGLLLNMKEFGLLLMLPEGLTGSPKS